jgi:hypothetical protein
MAAHSSDAGSVERQQPKNVIAASSCHTNRHVPCASPTRPQCHVRAQVGASCERLLRIRRCRQRPVEGSPMTCRYRMQSSMSPVSSSDTRRRTSSYCPHPPSLRMPSTRRLRKLSWESSVFVVLNRTVASRLLICAILIITGSVRFCAENTSAAAHHTDASPPELSHRIPSHINRDPAEVARGSDDGEC